VNNLNDYAYVECVDKAKALIKKNDDAMSALIGDREAWGKVHENFENKTYIMVFLV